MVMKNGKNEEKKQGTQSAGLKVGVDAAGILAALWPWRAKTVRMEETAVCQHRWRRKQRWRLFPWPIFLRPDQTRPVHGSLQIYGALFP